MLALAQRVTNLYRFRCLHFRTGQIETPPHLPIPGDNLDSEKPSMSTKPNRLPRFSGKMFTAMCGFWSIIHDVI